MYMYVYIYIYIIIYIYIWIGLDIVFVCIHLDVLGYVGCVMLDTCTFWICVGYMLDILFNVVFAYIHILQDSIPAWRPWAEGRR